MHREDSGFRHPDRKKDILDSDKSQGSKEQGVPQPKWLSHVGIEVWGMGGTDNSSGP
jgi:hypothetical protein